MNDEMNQNNLNTDSEVVDVASTTPEPQQPNFIMYQQEGADASQSEMTVKTGSYEANEMREIHNDAPQAPEQVQDEYSNQDKALEQTPNYIPSNIEFVNPTSKKEKKKKTGKGKRIFKKSVALVSAAALFGVIAGVGFQGVNYLADKNEKPSHSSTVLQAFDEYSNGTDSTSSDTSTESGSVVQTNSTSAIVATDVSGVVANVMPAIVAINCTSTMTQYDFFGRAVQNEVSGSGSGIIIGQSDDELLIVTNNHVVDGATALEIVFADETKALATIKGTEANSDLAVVSVKMSDISSDTLNNIRVATLGDSDTVKTGEMAIAIGNALGYGQSVTVGYISALNREVTTEDTTQTLLQTDAAINPGNSGGALINTKGEIIGINSVKYASTDVEGIGYAIPISTAIPIINELMNREDLSEDEMGYLGITGKNVEESIANAFNMPMGISVYEVGEGTPAEAAGIKKGDIIVGMNDKKIETMQDLQNTLSYTRAGTTVTINMKVLENGQYIDKDVEVTLGNRSTAQ